MHPRAPASSMLEAERASLLTSVVVTPDSEDWPAEDLLLRLGVLLDAGVTAVMFREKRLDDAAFLHLGRRVKDLCDRRGALFWLNERIHLQPALNADLCHLTFRSPDLARAKELLPDHVGVTASVHDVEEGVRRIQDGLDGVVFGPIFPVPSKKGRVPVQGLEALRELVRRVSVPVVAIGGMNPERLRDVRACGATGAAAIRFFFENPHGRRAVEEWRRAWE